MPAPCYFEIHADDCKRAQRFYGEVFGWSFTSYEAADIEYYRIATNEPGAMMGGLLKRPGAVQPMQAPNAFVVTLLVPSLDAYIEKAVAAGAIVALPKFAVKAMGWTAYLVDTEKNVFGLFQEDAGAQ
jgi:uncharacterized protein